MNGNECYCSTFVKQTAGADERCDVKCGGNPDQLCGGNTKSSVFALSDRSNANSAPLNGTHLDFYGEHADTLAAYAKLAGTFVLVISFHQHHPCVSLRHMHVHVVVPRLARAIFSVGSPHRSRNKR